MLGYFTMAMSADGSYLAGAGWGNQHKTSPTIAVWKTQISTPVFTLISPGTDFCCLIVQKS
jgi:hypothetical protein